MWYQDNPSQKLMFILIVIILHQLLKLVILLMHAMVFPVVPNTLCIDEQGVIVKTV